MYLLVLQTYNNDGWALKKKIKITSVSSKIRPASLWTRNGTMPKYGADMPYICWVPRLEARNNDHEFSLCWLKGTRITPSKGRTEPDLRWTSVNCVSLNLCWCTNVSNFSRKVVLIWFITFYYFDKEKQF